MVAVREASPDQAAFLEELVEAGLIVPSGVPGVYGRNATFEDVRLAFEARHLRRLDEHGFNRKFLSQFPPPLIA